MPKATRLCASTSSNFQFRGEVIIISILNRAHIKYKAFLCRTNSTEDYLHMKHKNYQEDSSRICQAFKLTTSNVRNPMFVVEYEYVLHEARNVIFLIVI